MAGWLGLLIFLCIAYLLVVINSCNSKSSTLSDFFCNTTEAMDSCRKGWNSFVCSLYLHGGTGQSMAALLFTAEAYTKLSKDTSCTSQPSRWLSPNMQNVNNSPISEIRLSAPATKKKGSKVMYYHPVHQHSHSHQLVM